MIYELEEAASTAAEEEEVEGVEGDDEEDEKAHRLRISLSHSRSVPAHLEDADGGQTLQLADANVATSVSRPSSSPLPGDPFNRPPSSPSQIHERSSSSLKTYMVSTFFHDCSRLNVAFLT